MKTGATERRLVKALTVFLMAFAGFMFIAHDNWRLALGLFLLIWAWKLGGVEKP